MRGAPPKAIQELAGPREPDDDASIHAPFAQRSQSGDRFAQQPTFLRQPDGNRRGAFEQLIDTVYENKGGADENRTLLSRFLKPNAKRDLTLHWLGSMKERRFRSVPPDSVSFQRSPHAHGTMAAHGNGRSFEQPGRPARRECWGTAADGAIFQIHLWPCRSNNRQTVRSFR